ncbi:MAG: formylglycine-generating enzyme family protein [Candidatus Eremiobacterota bacterium]
MVLISKGTYTLSQFNPPQITFTHDYSIGKYEITNSQYRAWPDAQSHHTNTAELNNSTYDNCPVRYVSWMDVVQYCNWRSSYEGLTPCYTIGDVNDHTTYILDLTKNGYRLPTEAEWEYACRGGTTTTYYWGNTLNAATGLNKCWYGYNVGGTCTTGLPAPVGYGWGHPWGLYDMSGNMWEWCHNIWENTPTGGTDPVGPASGNTARSVRGGSWSHYGSFSTSSFRGSYGADGHPDDRGFRVVRTE